MAERDRRECLSAALALAKGTRSRASIGLRAGFAAFWLMLIVSAATHGGKSDPKAGTAGCALLMVIFWLSEALPLAVTALMPVVLLPVTGVAPAGDISSAYFSDPIILFFGTFVLAAAVEKHGLHRRAALLLLQKIGTDSPPRVLMAFIVTTAFISMWLNNTATAAMMMPLAQAVLAQMRPHRDNGTKPNHNDDDQEVAKEIGTSASVHEDKVRDAEKEWRALSAAVSLGIAFSASLGGLSTLTGTGPNIILHGVLGVAFPDGPEISFIAWFTMVGPIAWAGVAALWLLLALWHLKWGAQTMAQLCAGVSSTLPRAISPSPSLLSSSLQSLSSSSVTVETPFNGTVRSIRLVQGVEEVDEIELHGASDLSDDGADGDNQNRNYARPSTMEEISESMRQYTANVDPRGGQSNEHGHDGDEIGKKEELNLEALGPMTWAERVILADFALLVLLWCLREPHYFPGWASLLPVPTYVSDGTCAMFAALLLFFVPDRQATSVLSPGLERHVVRRGSIDSKDRACRPQAQEEVEQLPEGDGTRWQEWRGLRRKEHKQHLRLSTASEDYHDEGDCGERREEHSDVSSGSRSDVEDRCILEWKVVNELPWDIIFLLGGGYALSVGFNESGLSAWIANAVLGSDNDSEYAAVDDSYNQTSATSGGGSGNDQNNSKSSWTNASLSDGDVNREQGQNDTGPDNVQFLTILVLSILLSSSMSNLVSNVATANIILPLLSCIAVRPNCHPWLILVPCTAACSCAFLFPIATPPNAIGYSTGFFTIQEMVVVGSLLTAIMFLLLAFAVGVTIPAAISAHGENGNEAPAWARVSCGT